MKGKKSFRLKIWGKYLIVAMIYPVIAFLTSDNSLLKLIDAMTITGLILLIIGVVFSLRHHGDFDIMEYVTQRAFHRGDIKPFRAFLSDKKEERKDSYNYPSLTGCLLLIVSALLALLVY